MPLLHLGVCMGNGWTRLAKPKSQLPKQSLALPHSQLDSVPLLNESRQRLSIPKIFP